MSRHLASIERFRGASSDRPRIYDAGVEFASATLDLWSDVTGIGHRVVRDLDDKEVPASLRRVAASDRLPPPLTRALLRELDSNDWLREKVATEWHEQEQPDPTRSARVAALFLDRPDGWEAGLAGLIAAESAESQQDELARAQAEVERLTAELQVARSRTKAAEKKMRQAEKEAAARTKANRADTNRALREGSGREAELASQLDEARKDLDRQRQELRTAHEAGRILKGELLRARRAGAPPESASVESPWSVRDPVALAKHLDQLASASAATASPTPPEPEAKGLAPPPKGVRPDEAVMIDWLLSQATPTTLLVDGYNVTYHLDPVDFHTAEVRERLNQGLARLRQAASGPLRVVVVYDSGEGGDEEFSGPGGVEVRFTDRGVLADDVILDLVSDLPGLVVAVSSDRFVRETAEARGARGLWSQALAGWISR